MMKRIKNKNEGFTLIELLISAGILGFLITGMVIMLQQQQRQFNFTKEFADIDTTGRLVLNLLASEIRNAGARQGKAFSLKFINGGSTPDGANAPCTEEIIQSEIPNNATGTKDSPPDCITIYTWDITEGMTTFNDQDEPELNLPSTTETSLFYINNGNSLTINLPESWFDSNGNFIDRNRGNEDRILLGFRSRQTLCNPVAEIHNTCNTTPYRCSECAVIMEATLDEDGKEAIADEIIEHNFPIDQDSGFEDVIQGNINLGANNFAFVPSIASTPMEFSLIHSKSFRVDTESRGLRLRENLTGGYNTIAGGAPGDDNRGFLEAPGIIDLQFVFTLQDQDGGVTFVGMCENADCNNSARRIFSDFNQPQTRGREQDIRSVEITLVLKSKIRPIQQAGGFYEQTIPAIADVAARSAPEIDGSGSFDDSLQSVFNEPERGFIYRVYSTNVYLRNHAREEPL